MTRLVTDLITLARMDAGQGLLHAEDLDLSEIAGRGGGTDVASGRGHGVMVRRPEPTPSALRPRRSPIPAPNGERT